MMLATFALLGEALCARAAEHDLHGHPPLANRIVFAFEAPARDDQDAFAEGFDVLHQTFLGYPLALAPPERLPRFHRLYLEVAGRHPRGARLTPAETAWVAVCAALVVHPEAELY
jgi:hypothetical protein